MTRVIRPIFMYGLSNCECCGWKPVASEDNGCISIGCSTCNFWMQGGEGEKREDIRDRWNAEQRKKKIIKETKQLRKKGSNMEWIRTACKGEIAAFLTRVIWDGEPCTGIDTCDGNCKQCLMNWLDEAKEE